MLNALPNSSRDNPAVDAPRRVSGHPGEVARLFLRLGLTAFGGPAAHIALMEDETVTRRGWLSHEQFLDLLGMANLLPGPSSSEMAIYLGFKRAGWIGLVLGGVCFILPAALLTALLAWAYLRFGALPQTAGMLYGIRPVVVAIVLQALWRLGHSAMKNTVLIGVGICALVLSIVGMGPVWVLALCGFVTLVVQQAGTLHRRHAAIGFAAISAAGASAPVTLTGLFLVFLKLGFLVFGSGYVLLAFLRADLVARLHWLTERQLLDAVAVGQFTPGPVFTTATFIGYLLGGTKGAVIATVAIFLPAFLLVAATGPVFPRLRKSAALGAVLDGVNAGSLGLMAAVAFFLGRSAVFDLTTALITVVSAVLLLRSRINPAWLILAGAVLGTLLGFRSWH
jgi:chromate transporter